MFDDPKKLYFFFDFISHNAWLAWNKVGALAETHGLVLEPVPVVFGALLKAHGQVGPAEVPPKSRWMLWNVLRKAQQHRIPIAPPFSHPFNPLLILRLSCLELPPAQRLRLIQCLFEATWMHSRAVHEETAVTQVLAEAGFDAPALLAQAGSEAIKSVLRGQTEAALSAGIFGVPSMRVRGELFWGFDDLAFLQDFLEDRDPLGGARQRYQPWFQVQPSVQRKR